MTTSWPAHALSAWVGAVELVGEERLGDVELDAGLLGDV